MHIKDAIGQKSGTATITGWIYRERGNNNLRFLVVRDSDDIIQCVVKRDVVGDELFEQAESLKVEASVELTGELKADERAPTGVEMLVQDLEVIGESVDFPITEDYSKEHLADNRHLWLRSRKMTAVMKIRATCFEAFRTYFREAGFTEFHSPIFQATQAEGGSELFRVKYFDDEVFLSQTWQLYAEAGIFGLEDIFTIGPTFRAENSKTSRHLTEFWMAEMEQCFCEFEDLQDHGEGVMKAMLSAVLTRHQHELEILERDTKGLEAAVDKPYPRITYTQALEQLKEECGMDVEWGKDLRTVEEDELSKLYDTPIIVTEYPTEVKAFYMKEVPGKPEVVQGYDLIGPEGYGELIGGSQREEDIQKIKQRLRRDGEDPEEYGYYLDTRKYGSVPHGGFGIGMERVIAWICGLDTIKDAIPFPRTPTRYTP